MKISAITASIVGIRSPGGHGPSRNWIFVRVETDAGIVGLGEATTEWHEHAVKAMIEHHMAPLLMGQDPSRITFLWQQLYRGFHFRGGIVATSAISGIEIVDFFHACEHLKKGLDADLGEGTADAKAYFVGYRESLRDDDDGVERVIRTLLYRVNKAKGAKAKKIRAELTYFRNHRQDARHPPDETLRNEVVHPRRAGHPDAPELDPKRSLAQRLGLDSRELRKDRRRGGIDWGRAARQGAGGVTAILRVTP